MIKTLSVFISVLLLFIASAFFQTDEPVSVQPVVPSSLKPGDEFIVELKVDKGTISGFGSLQQFLPEGFIATPVELRGGEFTFEKQHVSINWKELPSEASFTVSYKVKTNASCSGLKTVNGEFAYVENDVAKKVSMTPSVLTMNEDILITNAMLEEMNREITVEKIIRPVSELNGKYMVYLKISKGTKQSAARIFDQLIDGYSAEILDAKGGQFSVASRLAEFYWERLPADTQFTVSYSMVADSSMSASYSITQLLKFEDEENDLTASCCPTNGKTLREYHTGSSQADFPPPQNGIYFKVQIAATRRSPERTNSFFLSKYRIDEPVDLTMHEGWKKYLIGTFEKYAAAKQHRSETQAKVPDAFVVAYNNGERIPLQEALKTKKRNQ
ncbi:MAG: hypothetical protein NT126_07520 [Bacteroidetes bacterium]|nr:hypothetical protein [Bacteroidota bacterium]